MAITRGLRKPKKAGKLGILNAHTGSTTKIPNGDAESISIHRVGRGAVMIVDGEKYPVSDITLTPIVESAKKGNKIVEISTRGLSVAQVEKVAGIAVRKSVPVGIRYIRSSDPNKDKYIRSVITLEGCGSNDLGDKTK